VNEVIDAGDWQNEDDDFFPDDDSVDADPEEDDY
jgi:hypothetical protein